MSLQYKDRRQLDLDETRLSRGRPYKLVILPSVLFLMGLARFSQVQMSSKLKKIATPPFRGLTSNSS